MLPDFTEPKLTYPGASSALHVDSSCSGAAPFLSLAASLNLPSGTVYIFQFFLQFLHLLLFLNILDHSWNSLPVAHIDFYICYYTLLTDKN